MKRTEEKVPTYYLSQSEGRYRIIGPGAMPIMPDVETETEVLMVARWARIDLGPIYWDGDAGHWVNRFDVHCKKVTRLNAKDRS